MKTSDSKNILEALQLQDLTPEQQEEVLNEMSDVIVQGTMLRLIDSMDDPTRIEFEKLLDSDAPEQEVDDFIKKHVPDSDKALQDTLDELRDDILADPANNTHMNEQLNVTSVGIAVALAVIIAGALLFFGPSIFSFFNPAATTTQPVAQATNVNNPTTSMQDNSQPASDISLSDIPANVTELMSKDLVVGTGDEAKSGDSVTVNYVGMLTNGTVFDASANHGSTGFTFDLGAGKVIKGWDQGVVGMKVGGKRELVIPASLAYGAQSVGSIPANSTLVFEVELMKVTPAQ